MGIIAWIVFGLLAGIIAKAIMPGRDPGGFFITVILGIVGAFVGGFLGNVLFANGGISGFDFRSMIMAVIGAIVVLFIYRAVSRRTAAGPYDQSV